jgi:nucleotide-binding universal stress UspA family protein
MAKTILIAYDGSDEARRTLDHAGDLVRVGDRVVLINVMPEPGVSAEIGPPAHERNHQWQLLEEARRIMAGRDITAETLAPCGDAAAEILAAADDLQPDLIVVAPHPHRAPHLLGTVTGRVVRAATCDVLVVHVADASAGPAA